MALPTSGPLTLDQIHIEAGGSSGTLCSLNDADIRGIINKSVNASNAFSEYRGQSAETSLPTGGSQINGQVQLKEITVSDYISSGETLRIPSSMWVWSDSTSTPALIIDISCTVINDGKVIGKGGEGGWGFSTGPTAGGPAISVTASGVTITNSSGAYIAGGGGGGGAYSDYSNPSDAHAGGGGGAGGGKGGRGRINQGYWQQGTGGILNASGGAGGNGSGGAGGGAGGAGGGHQGGGGGGGRILPGVGGGGGNSAGDGGSAGNAGVSGGPYVFSLAGGGGGWGAAGGLGGGRYGGAAGGAAISGTSRTLNNSGTIYGST